MSDNPELQLKAAAYQIAATKGVNQAMQILEKIKNELLDELWKTPHRQS